MGMGVNAKRLLEPKTQRPKGKQSYPPQMADLEYRKLDPAEAETERAQTPAWQIEGGKLTRTFTFERYKDGVVFATAVAHLADRLDHHPDIEIGYAKVRVSVNTHSVEGLSPYDFELAKRIDAIV